MELIGAALQGVLLDFKLWSDVGVESQALLLEGVSSVVRACVRACVCFCFDSCFASNCRTVLLVPACSCCRCCCLLLRFVVVVVVVVAFTRHSLVRDHKT